MSKNSKNLDNITTHLLKNGTKAVKTGQTSLASEIFTAISNKSAYRCKRNSSIWLT